MKAERVDITPVGIDRREALTLEKPKFEMMMPLKVVKPPLGMLMAIYMILALRICQPNNGLTLTLKKKMIQVFGSRKASLT